MDNVWFNEDDDKVYGIKSMFEDEEEFIKEANKLHVELTGVGCIVDNVQTDIFLNISEPLEAEMIYSLKDTKVEIQTLYHADCEILEILEEDGF